MKTKKLIVIYLALFAGMLTCLSQSTESNNTEKKSSKVAMYYFHHTRRCATCNAVERVTKETLSELYGQDVVLTSLNLDIPEDKKKGKELNVHGQSLLIVSGKTTINVTNEGFLYARSKPEKLKRILKEKIDPLLK